MLGIKGLRIGVVRHFWEKDLARVTPSWRPRWTPRSAFCASSAHRSRTSRCDRCSSYSDVKIVMAESELFSLHLPELIARPEQFGQDFRARSLAACLFTAEDYVRASRERRAIMAEMRRSIAASTCS